MINPWILPRWTYPSPWQRTFEQRGSTNIPDFFYVTGTVLIITSNVIEILPRGLFVWRAKQIDVRASVRVSVTLDARNQQIPGKNLQNSLNVMDTSPINSWWFQTRTTLPCGCNLVNLDVKKSIFWSCYPPWTFSASQRHLLWWARHTWNTPDRQQFVRNVL